MKANTKVTIAALIIIATIAVMMVTGFLNMSGRTVTIEQVLATGVEYEGKFLRTEGQLMEGYVFNVKDITLEFQITDGERILNVFYKGFQPDNFDVGIDVILTGNYQEDVFIADSVQTRCPSTYEAEVNYDEDAENPHEQ
ncbi:MAG: cytochrome c maturation protein CcmE [Clostridia bacterium]|jgi:cytochrome c-type biogenesis protein CcmE|nr:cytochrome c maturation protein CcmE [Clostridia bacterium]